MQTEEIKELLEDFHKCTGVSLSLDEAATFVDSEAAARILGELIAPWRRQADAGAFWKSYLTGELSTEQAEEGFVRYHIAEHEPVVLFLLHLPLGYDEVVPQILHDLSDDRDQVLSVDETTLVQLRFVRHTWTIAQVADAAATIADTLSADAMLRAYVSYDRAVDSVSSLPDAYRNAMLAMRIGTQLFSQEHVYAYHSLGLGKLVYRLAEEDCREFLSEHLKGFSFDSLDAELSSTIHAFLDAGLSVAEAARRLFIHRNTLLYRLDKFEKLSGLDLRAFDDAVTVKLAMLMEARLS